MSRSGFPTPPAGKSWLQSVSEGKVLGYSTLGKFGYNPAIATTTDPETVWEGGGVYNYSTTADIQSLASDNALDTQSIKIQGLDILGRESIQTYTLTGTTRVALDPLLYRVYRMENMGTTDLAGTIFCYTGTGAVPAIGDAEVKALIDNGNNQTLMALSTVPLGKVGFLYRGEGGLSFSAGPQATDYANVEYRTRLKGGVFKIQKRVSIITTGTSIFQDALSFPVPLPALTDIEIYVSEVSAIMGVWAIYEMLLVDEDQLAPEFLDAIGQPTSL